MREPFQLHAGICYLAQWQAERPQLRAGFTTRNGGVSKPPFASFNLGLHVSDQYDHVITNRKMLADKLGMPLDDWVAGEQVHSTHVEIVRTNDKGKGSRHHDTALKGTDGLVVKQSGILCTAFFADCVPLYFFDPQTGCLGLAHAGWKGTVGEIARKMVEKMKEAGAAISNIRVAIGPCIAKEAYEVDDQVMKHIKREYAEQASEAKENGRYLLDLKRLNMEILLNQGVLRHNIAITNYCTFRDASLFFSHRRDGGKTGRMLAFIGYLP